MRQKFLVLLMALLCGMQVMASSIVIKRYAGANMVQDIALIGKWVFVDTNLQLIDKEGTVLATEPIANIQQIVFSDTCTAVEDIVKGSIVVYPNPTQDILMVENAQGDMLRLYTMDGRLLETQPLTNGSAQVNMANLPTGNYLLLSGNQSFQVIKQ